MTTKNLFQLYMGDCKDILKQLPDNSIDCIITDPPYFLDGLGDTWDLKKLNKKTEKSKVVKSLPIGMKFDPAQGKELEKFIFEISTELYRILKPGGFYISFAQGRLYHRMAVAIEDSGFEIRDMFIWQREGQAKAFSQTHFVNKMNITDNEKAIILSKLNNRKTPQLKSQSEPMVLAQKPKDGTFVNNWIKWETGLVDTSQSLDGKFPGTIMKVPKPKGKEREIKHFTVKPVTLIEHLIKLFTIEGQTILDPFNGSGTTGIAAINTNRKYIGIEKNKTYFDLSLDRLKKHDEGRKNDR